MGRHPFGALQVAFPAGARPFGLSFGVHAQHDPRHFSPVRALRCGVEETQIGDEMVVVVILALRMCLMAGGLTARRE